MPINYDVEHKKWQKREAEFAKLQAELDAYDADYTLCDCCNCLTPDPIDCGEHVQCRSCTRLAELEAENKLLDEIAELPRYVCEMHEIGKIGAALRYRDVLKVLKQREKNDETHD